MSTKASKDSATDLHDSTDWLTTPLPSLRAVDAALRCQVCKDLYNTPMITSCSHTFCSLCIRRSLTHDGKCPACRASDQEMKLRQNWAVGELVEAFKQARPEILEFVKVSAARRDSPKRKLDEVEDVASSVQKRTRSGRRIQSSSQVIVPEQFDDDGDSINGDDEEPADDLAACPICQSRMTIEAVGFHIDKCDGIPISKKIIAKAPAPKPERLPHPHYSGLKDTALRKKLADQGIISTGSRQLMERRYTEWVTLWNANCDSKTPRGKSDLRRELDTWERTQGGKANMNGRDQVIGAQIRDKDFDGKAWAAKNDEAFKDLIAKARRKPAPKAAAPEPSSTGGDESVESQMESQIQDASRQDLPGGAVTSYTQYQSTSALDEDIVSSDIADIAHINTVQ